MVRMSTEYEYAGGGKVLAAIDDAKGSVARKADKHSLSLSPTVNTALTCPNTSHLSS